MTTVTTLAANCLVTLDFSDYIRLPGTLSIKKDKTGYTCIIFSSGKLRHKALARYLLGIVEDCTKLADHIDRNPLNNTRINLRAVDATLSARNRNTWGVSLHKGVYKNGKYWASSIMVKGKAIFLGTFLTENLASAARIRAELLYWSETE